MNAGSERQVRWSRRCNFSGGNVGSDETVWRQRRKVVEALDLRGPVSGPLTAAVVASRRFRHAPAASSQICEADNRGLSLPPSLHPAWPRPSFAVALLHPTAVVL
ncbi:hypothetical protein GUJ93_ZPchr0002g26459 [Zizania palustris]|uniref:Uncharacterized protein n=1 Tax=Zizania palustris TaxID=103762 RepID=A0A8J5RGN8_ZIZPA|nr:hypothetical protein GUJ93_ZPchr0002g26459 [Zizania palustris]